MVHVHVPLKNTKKNKCMPMILSTNFWWDCQEKSNQTHVGKCPLRDLFSISQKHLSQPMSKKYPKQYVKNCFPCHFHPFPYHSHTFSHEKCTSAQRRFLHGLQGWQLVVLLWISFFRMGRGLKDPENVIFWMISMGVPHVLGDISLCFDAGFRIVGKEALTCSGCATAAMEKIALLSQKGAYHQENWKQH